MKFNKFVINTGFSAISDDIFVKHPEKPQVAMGNVSQKSQFTVIVDG
ncbi:MAG: hypothetical protein KKC99_12420 [Proteobacteria bacterium]|nr:hypothetical protein [Pseudomonadota bacterium]